MSKKILFLIGVILLGFLGLLTIGVESKTHLDAIYIADNFNELYHSSAIIVRAKPLENSFRNQPNRVDTYQFRVTEVLKGPSSDNIKVRIDTTFRNMNKLELSEYQIDECEVLLFLSPFGEIYYLETPNAGLFVVVDDQVYSIGELDRDFYTLTDSVHAGGQKYSDFINEHIKPIKTHNN